LDYGRLQTGSTTLPYLSMIPVRDEGNMKVGDLIKLPQDKGYAIAMKIIVSKSRVDVRSVMVLAPYGEDWWDVDYCEVINEVG